MTFTPRSLWIALLAIALAASRAGAQAATAGTPVAATHLAAETNASVLPDGTGSAYVGFKIAYRSAALPAEIAVARITASAGRDPGWTALPLSPPGSLPQIAPPGPSRILRSAAGEVLSFADFSNPVTAKAIVRRLGASGADPGYPGFQPSYKFNALDAVPRSDGGALILSKALGSINLLATVVTAAGAGSEVLTPLAISNGITAAVAGEQLVSVPSGVDGGIAVFLLPFVSGATGVDIVAVRVDATGQPVWTPQYRVVASAVNEQRNQVVVSDGADGVIVVWDDGRNPGTAPDIYGERLLANGAIAPGWNGGGKSICNTTAGQTLPAIASDDAGGAWFAWQDTRSVDSTGIDLYFTHVLSNGTLAPGFVANGSALCRVAGDQGSVKLARDGSGGLFVVWLDARNGGVDLYAQHLNGSGIPTAGWAAAGNPVCTNSAAKASPAIGLLSPGRALAAWNDARTGTDIVYSAALDAVRGVLDVPSVSSPRLALAPRANPARGGIELALDSREAGEIRIMLVDISGRVQAVRTSAGPARSARVTFDRLRPGLYFATAFQNGARATTRVAVVR